jgi:hypothetical protein
VEIDQHRYFSGHFRLLHFNPAPGFWTVIGPGDEAGIGSEQEEPGAPVL